MSPLAGAVANTHLHPLLSKRMIANGRFPRLCNIQSKLITRTPTGGTEYAWGTAYLGLALLPCVIYDNTPPMETRTPDVIEALKFWMVLIPEYLPQIQTDWRVLMDDGKIYDIQAVGYDALHFATYLTVRDLTPIAEPGA